MKRDLRAERNLRFEREEETRNGVTKALNLGTLHIYMVASSFESFSFTAPSSGAMVLFQMTIVPLIYLVNYIYFVKVIIILVSDTPNAETSSSQKEKEQKKRSVQKHPKCT